MKSKLYRPDIQILRGLSLFAVLLFHAKASLFPLGYLGVDIFFVISGFVVTPLIIKSIMPNAENNFFWVKSNKLKIFYMSRVYRLIPALMSTLFISFLLVIIFGPVADHGRFTSQAITTLTLIGNIGAYRYSGNYFSTNPSPLLHLWSLCVESQIYIFIPFLLLIFKNKINSKKINCLTFALKFFDLRQ
jgi:peptidoglycan/LPS O-acetylase OafA/YrhL